MRADEGGLIGSVREAIERGRLIEAGDCVIAAVSGGADSVCLLRALCHLRGKMGFSLEAVHVEHGIRGEESEEDAAFVAELCESLRVPLRTYHVDVPAYAASRKMGEEEAARELRYECFARAAKEIPAGDAPRARVRIALAHHANDQAETVLFRLARGSGIGGLCGMAASRPLRDGTAIIRPLLFIGRGEIEAYLREAGQPYRVDSTNTDVGKSRNRIRARVMPELSRVNARAAEHIALCAARLAEVSEYLREEAGAALEQDAMEMPDGSCLIGDGFFERRAPVLQREAVHLLLERLAGGRDISSVHVGEVLSLFGRQPGRSVSLPRGWKAARIQGGVLIYREGQGDGAPAGFSLDVCMDALERGETESLPLGGMEIRLSVRDFSGNVCDIPREKYTKWLDYDKISGRLQLRTRRAGDYLVIDGGGHKKKLKEYLVGEKVPAHVRDGIPLLTDGQRVLWVVGWRIGADCKVGDSTRRILVAEAREAARE